MIARPMKQEAAKVAGYSASASVRRYADRFAVRVGTARGCFRVVKELR